MIDTNQDLKKRAFYLTVISNILFFLLLMIIVAWKETYPPPQEYGIELGLENNENSDLNNNIEESQSEMPNETSEDNSSDEEVESDPIIKDDNQKEVIKNDNESSDLEDLDKIELLSNNETTLPIDENIKKDFENNNVSEDSIVINKDKSSKKILDERAIFQNKPSSSAGSKGSSLDMQGWVWDFEPNPIDNSRESGRIVFEIIVDYYGEIIGLKTLETTLSPAIEDIYRDEILKLTFSPTNNDNPSELSKGKITFIIKNN